MSNFAIAPRGDAAMNVSLTPELEAMIRQQVDSGRYNNASEVVREALRLLDEHQRVQHLRSLLAVGLEQAQRGELVEFTPELMEDISRRAKERFLRGEEPDPDVCP
jgi:antitoxin ParD1/3/4